MTSSFLTRAAFVLPALAFALAGCAADRAGGHGSAAASAAPSGPVASPADLALAVRAVAAQKPPAGYRFVEDRLVVTAFGPVLLRRGRAPDGARADGGLVAAYYLRRDATGFSLVRAYPEMVSTGSFGDFAQWDVSTAFGTNPVVRVEGGGTWQGCTMSVASLVELTPKGPQLLADVPLYYDNGGAVERGAQRFTGTIGPIEPGQGFTVRYRGTRTFAERYVRDGSTYRLQGGSSRVPGC